MKKIINVIDLDKTLIAYDSFRLFISIELKKFDVFVIWITFLRVMRLNSMKHYKMKVVQYIQKKYTTTYFKEYADILFVDIDKQVLKIINKESKEAHINILLSASPHIYVKHLVQILEWEGSGSYFDGNGDFIHLYDKDKVRWLYEKYSRDKYKYNFAISDSSSDKELLQLFEKYVFWQPNLSSTQ